MTLQERLQRTRDVGQLAAAQGLPAAPLSAAGTATLGGTDQQQAMAGTPAQKKGAIAAAVTKQVLPQAETGLELAQRTRPEAAIDQAKAREMGRYSQALGTFGDKVNQLVESAVAAATAPTVKATLVLTPEKRTSIDARRAELVSLGEKVQAAFSTGITDKTKPVTADDVSRLGTSWEQLSLLLGTTVEEVQKLTAGAIQEKLAQAGQSRSADLEAALTTLSTQGQTAENINKAILTLNTLLGNDTTGKLLQGSALELYWKNINEGVAQQLETTVQTNIAGTDKILTLDEVGQLGTSWEELGSLLGMPPAEVQKLTIGQLQERLAATGQQQFGQTQTVIARAASPLATSAERNALRTVVQELEQSGIAGVEMQYQNLMRSIEEGKTVKLAGKDYTVEELLQQDTLYNLAMSIYNATDPKEIARLKQEEPALYNWLITNRDALIVAKDTATHGAQKLKDHNIAADTTRELFANSPLGKTLPTNYQVGKVISVDTTLDWDPKVVGQAVSDIVLKVPKQQQAGAIEQLGTLVTSVKTAGGNDEDVKGIMAFTAEQLTDPDFMSNALRKWSDYGTASKLSNNAQELLNFVIADDTKIEDINQQLALDDTRAVLGMPLSGWSQYDTNNNNVLDLAEIQAMSSSTIKKPTASDYGNPASGANSLRPEAGGAPTETMRPVFDAVANDGKLDPQELAGVSLDGMLAIFQAVGRPGEQAGAALTPLQSAIRSAYVDIALPKARAASYQGKGLAEDGLLPGLAGSMTDLDNRWGQAKTGEDFRRLLPTLQDTVNRLSGNVANLETLFKEATNPDLKWRYEQDLNKARQALDKYNKLLPQGKASAMNPMEKVVSGIAVAAEEVRDYISKNTEVLAGATPEAKRQLERAAGMEPGTLDRPAIQVKQAAGTVAEAVKAGGGTVASEGKKQLKKLGIG